MSIQSESRHGVRQGRRNREPRMEIRRWTLRTYSPSLCVLYEYSQHDQVHNHDCGPPLSSPKKFGIRPARVLPPGKKANKGKKSEIPDATTMPTPETSQSPPEEKEEDQLAEYSESDYSTKVPPTGPRSVGSVIGEARDISVFEASGGEEQAEQRRSRTSSVILDEASLVSAILGPSSLPIDHTTLLSCDDTSIHFLAVDFPSPLHPSPLPIDHTTLLSFDQPAPPVHDSSHFIHVPATNRSIEEFLRSAGKNLEQYSTGFAVAGYDDFDSLLRVSDEAISRFLTSDLVRLRQSPLFDVADSWLSQLALCPSLFTNLYHQQLVTSLVVAHRLERNAPFFQNADEVLGRLFHDPDLPPILSPIEDIPVELGTSRGTKRSFDDVFDELDHSNSLNYH